MNTQGAFHVVSRLALSQSRDVTVFDSLAEIAAGLALLEECDIARNTAVALREADSFQLKFLALIEHEEAS